jgi:hypothetical protein
VGGMRGLQRTWGLDLEMSTAGNSSPSPASLCCFPLAEGPEGHRGISISDNRDPHALLCDMYVRQLAGERGGNKDHLPTSLCCTKAKRYTAARS